MNELLKQRKSILGNEKGLTLIELLAVIVILGIIAAIAIPAIGGIVGKTKKNAHVSNSILIIDAARYKVLTDSPTAATTSYTLSTLKSEGYLESIPLDPDNKGKVYDPDSKVVVTYASASSEYSYEIVLAHDDNAGAPGTANATIAAANHIFEGVGNNGVESEDKLKAGTYTFNT